MRVTTKMRYGTRAMVDLAVNHGLGPQSASQIAANQEVSPKYLESILGMLQKAGLVRAILGPQGGYELARPPGEINLRMVFDVLEGAKGLVACTSDPTVCDRYSGCVTQEVWAAMFGACMELLEDTTLEDLGRRVREKSAAQANLYQI